MFFFLMCLRTKCTVLLSISSYAFSAESSIGKHFDLNQGKETYDDNENNNNNTEKNDKKIVKTEGPKIEEKKHSSGHASTKCASS